MLVVHHLGISQSERIVWLCEELGIPYQLQRHDRDPTTRMAPAAYPLPSMVRERLATASSMIERRLSEADYFAGERLTLADIMMVFALTTMRNFSPLDLGDMPSTRAYLKRIGERPAYRLAMEKGDPEMTPKLD